MMSQIILADKIPSFGKLKVDLNDTKSPEYKLMMAKIDSLYDEEERKGFSGSVLIGFRGKILYERYMGYADKDNNIKWGPNTNSQLASTSKPLTSAAVLILVDKGLVKLDENVKKYLPIFPYEGITVRMLLCHRSGLKDYIDFASAKPEKEYLDNNDILELFAEKKPSLLFSPNTNFEYSNSNYALLALVVESASGMDFKYFMERYVFRKLGMQNTVIHNPNETCPANSCKSYKAGYVHYKDNHLDGVYGDKGVYSCVRDLYKWDQALYTNNLLKYATINKAYEGQNFDKPGQRNYGLGWRMWLYPDTKVIYHNGWWHGNNTCFYRFINDNFSIIVLGNKYSQNIYKQPQKIFNIINKNYEIVLDEPEEE